MRYAARAVNILILYYNVFANYYVFRVLPTVYIYVMVLRVLRGRENSDIPTSK